MQINDQVNDQVSDQFESDAVAEKILKFCKIARTFLKPLLESNRLAYTIPEKPQNRL